MKAVSEGFTARRREYCESTLGSVPVDHTAAGHSPNFSAHALNARLIESPSEAMAVGTGSVVGVASSSTIVPVPVARVIDIPAGSDGAAIVSVSVSSPSSVVSGQTGTLSFFATAVVPLEPTVNVIVPVCFPPKSAPPVGVAPYCALPAATA